MDDKPMSLGRAGERANSRRSVVGDREEIELFIGRYSYLVWRSPGSGRECAAIRRKTPGGEREIGFVCKLSDLAPRRGVQQLQPARLAIELLGLIEEHAVVHEHESPVRGERPTIGPDPVV